MSVASMDDLMKAKENKNKVITINSEIENRLVTPVRTVEMVAAEINGIKDQTRKMLLVNAIEIGKRLAEAKEMVPYGDWGKWLEVSVDYSKSTATNLINIFTAYSTEQGQLFGVETKTQALGKLSYTQALVLLGVPAEEREAFVEENNVEDLSSRNLKKLVQEKKEAEERTAEFALLHKEDLEKIEKQEKELAEIKAKPKDDKSKEKIKELQASLKAEKAKIADLEAKAKEVKVVEKIPEAVAEELAKLRKKVAAGDANAEFKVNYKIFSDAFRALLVSASLNSKHAEVLQKVLAAFQADFIKVERKLKL